MGTPSDLFSLQKVDTKLFELRAKLNEIQQALQEPVDLIQTKTNVESLSKGLTQTNVEIKDQELQIGAVQEKLNRSNETLYSGKVNNPKELEDLQNEAQSLQSRIDDFELALMESMEKQEKLSVALKEHQTKLHALQEQWELSSETLRGEQGEIAQEMQKILGNRKARAEKIEGGIMQNYLKLLKSKSGMGIVPIYGSSCTGCKISMDGGTVRQVNSGQWVNCPSCGRYLIRES